MAWQSIVAAVFGFLSIPLFECACGYLDRAGLIATVPTFLLAWWGVTRRLSIGGRLLATVVAFCASLAFAKNLLDIGWLGHTPLFR